MRMFGGGEITRPCVYVDDNRFAMGSDIHDTREFARTMENNGWTFRPETPGKGDICDTYEIYQLRDRPEAREYEFMPYSYAKGKLRPAHYQLAYEGVLARDVTLEDLYVKHNRDTRPFGLQMKAMSMSDVVVLNRRGERKAYYVDSVGFSECGEFLKPPHRSRGARPKKHRKQER